MIALAASVAEYEYRLSDKVWIRFLGMVRLQSYGFGGFVQSDLAEYGLI